MRRNLLRSLRNWVAWGTLAVLIFAGGAEAQRVQAPPGLPVPRLLVVSPSGGQVGSTFEVTVAGLDIDEPQGLWFSATGIEAKRIDEPAAPVPEPAKDRNQRRRGMQGGPPKKAVKFQVTIPAGTRVGIHDVRLVNSWGASNPRAFVVGDLAEALEVEPNNDVPQAQRVALNATINGTIGTPTDVDDYVVACRKGQRVIVSALTSSIDSRLLVALQLYDATGRMLATNHEYRGQDALVDVTVPDDGDYLIRASSFTYTEGSDEHFYRLSVSTAPWIDAVFPPVVEPGKPTRITVFGRNLPGGTPNPSATLDGVVLETITATIDGPSDPKETQRLSTLDHVAPGSTGIDGFEYRVRNKVGTSNAALLTWARAPVVLDMGNNETTESAQDVKIPCEVVGRIERARDRDWYAFTAKKGDVYSIEALGERLGAPLDLYFLLRNAKTGQMVGEFDDDPETIGFGQLFTPSSDPARVRFGAPDDGRYELMVSSRESSTHAGPRHVYRVRIATEQPDFRLVIMPPSGNAPDAFNLRAGGNAEATVFVWRRDGFDGEISLSAEGLPKGVECPRQVIGSLMKQGTLVLTASADAEPWVGAITVRGEAQIGGETVVREARAATITWPLPQQQQQPNVPTISRLDRSLVLAVRDTAPFRLTASLSEITARQGEKVEVPLKIERGWPDAKVPIRLTVLDRFQGLPVNDVTISPDKSEAKVVIDIRRDCSPGVYSIVFRGSAQVPFVRDPKTKQKQNVPVSQPSTPVVLTVLPKELAGAPLLLIGNKQDDTISFVDTGTLKIVGTTTTGHHPHELAVTPDGKTAFAANYGAGDSLSVIDITARKESRKIMLTPYRDPHGIQVGRDGKKVYATCEADRAVVEIDVATGKVLRAFDTGQDVSHMLVLTPDQAKLYTANLRSGTATAIDLVNGKAVAQIATGAGCEGIDVSPDGREVWTANKTADTISVIDTRRDRLVATLPCSGRPIRVKFTPDGRQALVSCARSNAVAFYDVASRREIRRLSTGTAPIGLLIDPTGRRAYVSNTDSDRVSVIDLARPAIVGTIATGHEPDGLAIVGSPER